MREQDQVPAPGGLNARLKWALAAVVVLSAWARWWPAASPAVVAAATAAPGVAGVELAPAEQVALPDSLPRIQLSPAASGGFASAVLRDGLLPARFDANAVHPPQQQPPVAQPVPVATPLPAPEAPVTPAPDFRYLGQMTGPDGQRQTLLARGDKSMAVAVGAEVEGGYRVQAIDAQGIRLQHPGQGITLVIPVPPAPEGATP